VLLALFTTNCGRSYIPGKVTGPTIILVLLAVAKAWGIGVALNE
jgi:hypothetical protein